VKCNCEKQQKQQTKPNNVPDSLLIHQNNLKSYIHNIKTKKSRLQALSNKPKSQKLKQIFLVMLSVYFAQSDLAVKYFNK